MDDADRADERMIPLLGNRLDEIRRKVAGMPAGEPGTCDTCGEWSGRLVNDRRFRMHPFLSDKVVKNGRVRVAITKGVEGGDV